MANNIRPFQSDPDTFAIIGAAMAVHTELGCGFLESVYREALAIEFRLRGFEFKREVTLPVAYKTHTLPMTYRVDFICRGVLIEVKAVEVLAGAHSAQVINYLKAGGQPVGLLFNFGTTSLEHKRLLRPGVSE